MFGGVGQVTFWWALLKSHQFWFSPGCVCLD